MKLRRLSKREKRKLLNWKRVKTNWRKCTVAQSKHPIAARMAANRSMTTVKAIRLKPSKGWKPAMARRCLGSRRKDSTLDTSTFYADMLTSTTRKSQIRDKTKSWLMKKLVLKIKGRAASTGHRVIARKKVWESLPMKFRKTKKGEDLQKSLPLDDGGACY